MDQTALVVVDMQNAYCKPAGSYQKRGNTLLNLDSVVNNISVLLDHFRSTNRRIIFTKKSFKKDYSNIGLLGKLHPQIIALSGLKEGTWDTEIIAELEPRFGETVLVNNTYDPFYKTSFENLLAEQKIRRVILCGVVANICVQATMIGAFVRGVEPVLIRECTTSTSQLLLDAFYENAKRAFGWVASMDDVLKE